MLNPRDSKVLAKIAVTGCHASWYPPKHVLCPQPQTVCANWANFISEWGLNRCSTCIKFGRDPTRFRYSWMVPKVLAPTRMTPWPFEYPEVWGKLRIELVEFYKGVVFARAYPGCLGRCGIAKNCAYRLTGDFNTCTQPICRRKFLKKRSL